jgi:hypothetical protein
VSTLFPHRLRARRAAILASVLAAAIVGGFVANAEAHPSAASAASPETVVAGSSKIVAVQPSDAVLIARAAPERALLAEQAKEQAQQQAAAAAAAAAATAARAAAARAAAAAAATATLNVWTAGFQAQINACRGGVDVTAHYGTATVAQHWGCGGSSFPTAAGAVVRFTGLDAGTYRVIGVVAVLNAYVAKTNQLPRGYDMLFQTCRNNDSHTTEFIGLQKIG